MKKFKKKKRQDKRTTTKTTNKQNKKADGIAKCSRKINVILQKLKELVEEP